MWLPWSPYRFQVNSNLLHREEIGSFCLVYTCDTAEDEHQFIFDCLAYCSIRDSCRFSTNFWRPAPTLSSFFILHDHRVTAMICMNGG